MKGVSAGRRCSAASLLLMLWCAWQTFASMLCAGAGMSRDSSKSDGRIPVLQVQEPDDASSHGTKQVKGVLPVEVTAGNTNILMGDAVTQGAPTDLSTINTEDLLAESCTVDPESGRVPAGTGTLAIAQHVQVCISMIIALVFCAFLMPT